MYMASGFPWVDKTRRRSCHRRTHSGELDLFEAEHDENLGHRGTTLSRKIGLSTREGGHGYSTTTTTSSSSTRQHWREVGRASLDMPMIIRHTHQQHHTISQSQEAFLDTKDNKVKKHKPSSPGGKLASFFNSLISQAVSKKKKPSKSSPQSVKDLVEEDSPSPSGWRRRRRSSISHFRSSTTTSSSFSNAFASRKPNTTPPSTRTKRTSMSDIDTKSIESFPSVSGFRTPPPYSSKNTPIKPNKQTNNVSTRNQNCAGNLDWLDEKFKLSSEKQSSSKGLEKRSREFKRFVEEDGAESDSSSDLFELKLNYDHRDQLGYCGGGLPVYESTRIDSIKISSGAPITNGPFKNS